MALRPHLVNNLTSLLSYFVLDYAEKKPTNVTIVMGEDVIELALDRQESDCILKLIKTPTEAGENHT
jgi:hypothetical protein